MKKNSAILVVAIWAAVSSSVQGQNASPPSGVPVIFNFSPASGTVQFAVVAIGNPPPTYQWWQNGINQMGGNNSILTLANVGRAQNGAYAVMVTNALGGICSSNVILKVLFPQRLGSPVPLPDGSLQLTSSDINGGALSPSDLPNFEAQVSTNLVNWVTLPNALSLTNGTLRLQDNSRTNRPASFYRIIEH